MAANTVLKVPKLTDSELLTAFLSIQADLSDLLPTQVCATSLIGKQYDSLSALPDCFSGSVYSFKQVWIRIGDANSGKAVLELKRHFDSPLDEATIKFENNFLERIDENRQEQIATKLMTASHMHLRAAEAFVIGGTDSASSWEKTQQTMVAVLHGLQTATASLLTKGGEIYNARESQLLEKYQHFESKLKAEMEAEIQKRRSELESKESELLHKEEEFDTKAARFVSRKIHEEQKTELSGWITDWTLTAGTLRKRTVVHVISIVLFLAFFAAAIWSYQTSLPALTKVDAPWWLWLHFALRSTLLFGVSFGIGVFYIRWTTDWADRHAREEFLNRSRLLDVGRSHWLLEAVRDAEDQKHEIPPELIRELSKNLFEPIDRPVSSTTMKPQELGAMLLQSMASVRVKSRDGSEVELAKNSSKGQPPTTNN